MKRIFFNAGTANDTAGGEKPADQKGDKGNGNKPEKPLKPTLTSPSAKHGKKDETIVLRPGQVYVVPVKDGQELESEGFVTNNIAAQKHYSNKEKFVIKKKAS